jgi:hypothetical protein
MSQRLEKEPSKNIKAWQGFREATWRSNAIHLKKWLGWKSEYRNIGYNLNVNTDVM